MPSLELTPGFEEKLLETAVQSPAVAMMRLSLELDRQLRLILAVIGQLRNYTGQSPSEALDLIAKTAVGSAIPTELRYTVDSFWSLRNLVVHSGPSSLGYAMRALDYGFRILRMLQTIPRPNFIVAEEVPVFSDKLCINLRTDISGVILNHFGSNGENFGRHIHPSRRNYISGQNVSWEWDMDGKGWGESWYRDPLSGTIKGAWSESLEFIGRSLEEI